MNNNYLQAEAFSLKKTLAVSLFIHFLVILYIVFEPRIFPSPTLPLIPVYRVNLVSLPAAPAPEVVTPAPAAKAPAPVPPAPAAPKVKAESKPKLHHPAVKKVAVSARPAKKTAAAKTPASAAKTQDRSRELSQAIASVKKNLIEKIESQTESDLVILNPSSGADQSDPVFQRYLEEISRKIKAAWAYPATKPRQQLIVSIKIRADGQVTDARIEKSSQDPAYDASALRALQKANPLPPLPSLSYGRILEIGLRF